MTSEILTELPDSTKRPSNPGAEEWLGKKINVLDHGFVYLVDYMGNDESIVQAARVSYGRGTKSINETLGLIRYLRRHHHTTPFEMAEMKFHMKLPIFVARQVIRHRTANVNEISARYSILDKEFHVPDADVVGSQSTSNRQGRGDALDQDYAEKFRQELTELALLSHDKYEYYLNDDGSGKPLDKSRPMVARETAREFLPVDFYTQWYWKVDLHNLFHFLKLRMDPHAQYEVRQYADAMSEIVADSYPISWNAFVDYELEATNLTRPEKEILVAILENRSIKITKDEIEQAANDIGLTNKRERGELVEKFEDLKLLKK